MDRLTFSAAEIAPQVNILAEEAITANKTIVHFVGFLSEEMHAFMLPAFRQLAAQGFRQILITPDQARARALRQEFGDAICCLTAGRLRRNRPINWPRMLELLGNSLLREAPRVVHFYGAKAWMLGARMLSSNDTVSVVYSPHGSHALGSLQVFARLLAPLAITKRIRRDVRYVATSRHESALINRVYGRSAIVAESLIDPLLFSLPADRSTAPYLVTGGDSHKAAGFDLLVRLSVKLRGVADDLRVDWISGGNDQTHALLKAAQIHNVDSSDVSALARALAQAWFYVETTETRGFPVYVARAMAMAVPCIAPDTLFNRDLIEHGRTGLLFSGEAELIRDVGLLLQDKALRTRMGNAARIAAQARLHPERFAQKLNDIYAVSDVPVAVPTTRLQSVPL
ncbi:MAG TPA: glycosyltransferase family 4 protein [Rhodocyclaceae bacterium]|nr:glycosyltransferase family 4 protein [Rhodocyclaceae bacterium]